jgi:hypothetical protein
MLVLQWYGSVESGGEDVEPPPQFERVVMAVFFTRRKGRSSATTAYDRSACVSVDWEYLPLSAREEGGKIRMGGLRLKQSNGLSRQRPSRKISWPSGPFSLLLQRHQ